MAGMGVRLGLAALAATTLTACGGDEAPAKSPPPAADAPAMTPTPPSTATAAQPDTREFRDWRAVCDNGNRCAAYAGSDDGAWVMVRRDAGPGAVPIVLAGYGPAYGDEGPDQAWLTFNARDEMEMRRRPGGELAVLPSSTTKTLELLASASDIRLSVMDEGPEIPAAGAAAALLWIDERQGRLGATDALIRRGDRPAAAAPAAPALPRVTPAPAVDQGGMAAGNAPLSGDENPPQPLALPAAVEALSTVKACRRDTADTAVVQEAVMSARLGPQTELWGVPCSIGAYNASYALFVTGPGGANPRPAAFPTWRPHGLTEGDQDWLTNPVYDPKTRTISHFPRGRGIGDCGVIQSWTWTGRGFVLNEEKSMGDCWGMGSNRWPTTWRTR